MRAVLTPRQDLLQQYRPSQGAALGTPVDVLLHLRRQRAGPQPGEEGVRRFDFLGHRISAAGIASLQRQYDMNGRFHKQGGKNWIFPKEMNANRFFWDSHGWKSGSNHFCPSMGPNEGSVAMDSG